MCQYQRDSMAAAGSLVHKMHPDTIDFGPEVTEPVQPAFLRTPVEVVRPVLQQTPQVTEVCSLLPRRTRRWPRPPRVPDPRTQVGEDLVAQRDTELLRLEVSHCSAFLTSIRSRHRGPARSRSAVKRGAPHQANVLSLWLTRPKLWRSMPQR